MPIWKTMSEAEREEEEGSVAFNVLNKTVQLMLSFGVHTGLVTEFVDQTVKMKVFKVDHIAMAKEIIAFVHNRPDD